MQRFTLFSWAGLIVAATLFFTACQKEQPQTVENTTAQPAASGFRSTVEPCTAFDEADFLSNLNDAADQNVNYALYYLTYAYRQVNAQQPAAIAALKTAVQNSISFEVDLYAFANSQPTITATINSAVAAIAEQSTINFNYKTFLNPKLVHTQIQYKPMVVVPNAATADFSLPIYWAVGAQIDENIHPTKEDHIPVFYLDELGNCNFTTLGEAEAMALENPLFIITNGDLINPQTPRPARPQEFKENEHRSGYRVFAPTFWQDLFLINEAYERSGRIDYVVSAKLRRFNQNYVWQQTWEYHMNRSSLGLPMQVRFPIFTHQTMQPLGQYAILARQFCDAVVATYEFDWYAGRKTFGSICVGNGTELLQGLSKYSHEWYHFNPSTNTGFNFNAFLAIGSLQTYTTSKGYLRMQRREEDF